MDLRALFNPHLTHRSLRGRLAALVAVVAVPLAGLVVWMSWTDYRTALHSNAMSALLLADAVGTSTTQFIQDAERHLLDVAGVLGPELGGDETCLPAARRVGALTSFGFDVAVFRPDGSLRCSTRPPPEGAGPVNLAGLPWFERSVRGRGLVLGPPVQGVYSGRWVVPFLVPWRDDDGRVAALLGLSVEAERFQTLLAGIPHDPDVLLTITDADNRVLARSQAFAEFVGRTVPTYDDPGRVVSPGRWIGAGPDFAETPRTWGRADLPHLGWHVYVGVPTERIRAATLDAASRGGLVVAVVLLVALLAGRFVQRDIAGSLTQLRASVRAAEEGGTVSLPDSAPLEVREVGEQLNRTLHARDVARERARAAQAHLVSLLENAVLGIYVSDDDERFLMVNPALVAMLGYASTGELMPLGPRDLFFDEAAYRAYRARIDGRAVFRQVETVWRGRHGSPVRVELSGRTLDDGRGGISHEVHVQDVTAQRRLEEELQQTRKMEAVGRLAGGVAHDFNNLLTVVSANLQLVLEEGHVGVAGREEIRDAHAAAARAAVLTRKLLAFSRRDQPEPQAVRGDELIGGVHHLLRRIVPESIEFGCALRGGAARVFVDPGQLEQVVMNLVINARDAIAGRGRIELHTERCRSGPPGVEKIPAPRGWYALTVRDTGVGMPRDVLARVFEPFFTTKDVGEGTGLGLATAHAIVTQADGRIQVDSAPGRGSVFRVWLPVVAASAVGRAAS